MRALFWFTLAIAMSVLAAAVLAYPLYVVIHPLKPEWWFDKIAARVWIPLMLVGVIWVMRRLGLRTRQHWGYGTPWYRFMRLFVVGLIAGLVTMLPVTLSMLALHLRVLQNEVTVGALSHAILVGLGSGLAVGFLEETFFRGVIQGAVVRDLRMPILAILLVSLLFAALHFLASTRIPHDQVHWNSGLELLRAAFANFRTPTVILDRLLSLFAVGVLLGLVTHWTGNIALAVGLHAGWVWMMRATVLATHDNAGAHLGWLVSRGDGYTGWLVLGWTLVITAIAVCYRQRIRAHAR